MTSTNSTRKKVVLRFGALFWKLKLTFSQKYKWGAYFYGQIINNQSVWHREVYINSNMA